MVYLFIVKFWLDEKGKKICGEAIETVLIFWFYFDYLQSSFISHWKYEGLELIFLPLYHENDYNKSLFVLVLSENPTMIGPEEQKILKFCKL